MDALQLKLKAFCCRHISRWDIQVALRCGCPSIDRKVVNSGKRLRAYVGLDEGEVITWNYLLKSYLVAARFSFPINLKSTLHFKCSWNSHFFPSTLPQCSNSSLSLNQPFQCLGSISPLQPSSDKSSQQ